MLSRRALAVFAVMCAVLAGCERGEPTKQPIKLPWQAVQLPQPPDAPGRVLLRDAVTCGGVWYIVGGVMTADGDTKPAAWTSTDAQTWRSISFAPRSYYGSRSVIYTAGCRDGKLAAAGAKSGGAHGNPRVSTWFQLDDGSMDEVLAYFEMYGGNTAVDAAHLVGGPLGWMIAGNRTSGAAIWYSPNAKEFKILESAPELASDNRGRVWATDVAGQKAGWVLVGSMFLPGRTDRDPLAWVSADGLTWRRQAIAGTAQEDEALQRVITRGDDSLLATGLRGQTFGVWSWQGGEWRATGRFGATGTTGLAQVTGLQQIGNQLLTMIGDGVLHQLWISMEAQTWQQVQLPAAAPAGHDRTATITGSGDRLVLLVDDGAQASVWMAKV